MIWSLLPTIAAPMPFQMALDEVLFESQKGKGHDPLLRFYVSSETWISVGYSFRDEAALGKSSMILQNPRVPVCRRITGGGCVLHGKDLIFSLIAPFANSESALGSVRTSYKMLHDAVQAGLQSLGLDAKFYACNTSLPKGSDCFDFPVESDLSWNGKKIAGGAQKRSDGVLLHHESISIPAGIGRDAIICAIRAGLEKVFNVTIQNVDMNPDIYFQVPR